MTDGWQGVRKDVAVQACPVEPGEVTAHGTIVNSAAETRDLAILVSWNRVDSTSTMLQLAWSEPNVAAGETVEWAVTGQLPDKSGQCIVNGRSGAPANPAEPSATPRN